jgi:hypothetical protein
MKTLMGAYMDIVTHLSTGCIHEGPSGLEPPYRVARLRVIPDPDGSMKWRFQEWLSPALALDPPNASAADIAISIAAALGLRYDNTLFDGSAVRPLFSHQDPPL